LLKLIQPAAAVKAASEKRSNLLTEISREGFRKTKAFFYCMNFKTIHEILTQHVPPML